MCVCVFGGRVCKSKDAHLKNLPKLGRYFSLNLKIIIKITSK